MVDFVGGGLVGMDPLAGALPINYNYGAQLNNQLAQVQPVYQASLSPTSLYGTAGFGGLTDYYSMLGAMANIGYTGDTGAASTYMDPYASLGSGLANIQPYFDPSAAAPSSYNYGSLYQTPQMPAYDYGSLYQAPQMPAYDYGSLYGSGAAPISGAYDYNSLYQAPSYGGMQSYFDPSAAPYSNLFSMQQPQQTDLSSYLQLAGNLPRNTADYGTPWVAPNAIQPYYSPTYQYPPPVPQPAAPTRFPVTQQSTDNGLGAISGAFDWWSALNNPTMQAPSQGYIGDTTSYPGQVNFGFSGFSNPFALDQSINQQAFGPSGFGMGFQPYSDPTANPPAPGGSFPAGGFGGGSTFPYFPGGTTTVPQTVPQFGGGGGYNTQQSLFYPGFGGDAFLGGAPPVTQPYAQDMWSLMQGFNTMGQAGGGFDLTSGMPTSSPFFGGGGGYGVPSPTQSQMDAATQALTQGFNSGQYAPWGPIPQITPQDPVMTSPYDRGGIQQYNGGVFNPMIQPINYSAQDPYGGMTMPFGGNVSDPFGFVGGQQPQTAPAPDYSYPMLNPTGNYFAPYLPPPSIWPNYTPPPPPTSDPYGGIQQYYGGESNPQISTGAWMI